MTALQPPTPEEVARARSILKRDERWKAALAQAREELARPRGPLVFLVPSEEERRYLPPEAHPQAAPSYTFAIPGSRIAR